MLVLSRRENDRISFPALGITIQVVRLSRSRAAIGIEAPKGIRVIREELLDPITGDDPAAAGDDLVTAIQTRAEQILRAEIRDEVDSATDLISRARQRLSQGETDQAMSLMDSALERLDSFCGSPERREVKRDARSTDQVAEVSAPYGRAYGPADGCEPDASRGPRWASPKRSVVFLDVSPPDQPASDRGAADRRVAASAVIDA
ncbi:carbon storage regulator [Roseiconus nitratireducens]|nr:carbon storage regulator [Roseiconus nitratireducens]